MRAASKLRYWLVSYPELSKCVYVLGFQESVIVAVHKTFSMDNSCIIDKNGNIPDLCETTSHPFRVKFTVWISNILLF